VRRMVWRLPINRDLLKVVLAVVLWLFVGSVFYWAIGNCSTVPRLSKNGSVIEDFPLCPWHFSHAFYYSVQTGMSIGFGLLTESKPASELYSCFHILAGSSFIGGALSFFVSLALTRHGNFISESEQRLLKACLALHADGYHGLTLTQLRKMLLQHPEYANELIRKVSETPEQAAEFIDKFGRADQRARRKLANRILKEACEKVECFKQGNVGVTELLQLDEESASCGQRVLEFLRAKANFIRLACACVAWIVVGALFSHLSDGHDAITSVYCAISALSTAGIISTNTVESDAHVLFFGVYCLIGVPLYACMLGSFANLLTEKCVEQETATKLNSALTDAETAFLAHLAGVDGNTEVDLAEYTELQLLRLGVVDRDTLRTIRAQFRKLDVRGCGRLCVETFVHPGSLPVAPPPSKAQPPKAGMNIEL